MRKPFACILLILLGNSLFAQKRGFPTYPAAYRHLKTKYDLRDGFEPVLEKRPDGWWLAFTDYDPASARLKVTSRVQFWSKNKGSYLKLSNPRRDPPVSDDRELTAITDLYNFERCVYYGYDQWSWDVINDYGNRKDLNDPELESLSRAYSHYANGFLNEQWGYLANRQWRKPLGAGPIPEVYADSFILFEKLSIATAEKIAARNPNYQVAVGHIRNKIANEYLHMYFQLHLAGFPEKAEEWLSKANYDPEMLTMAKNFLSGLPENAILLSNGDNDTYSVWFVQHRLGYRRDVSVINLSLLGMTPYIRLITGRTGPYGGLRAVAFEKDTDQITAFYLQFIQTGTSAAFLSGDSLLNFFMNTRPEEAAMLDVRHFLIRYRNQTIKLSLPEAEVPYSHWTLWQFHLLDIVQSNDRPIWATEIAANDNLLKGHWIFRSLNAELISQKSTADSDSAAVADWLINQYIHIPVDPRGDAEKDRSMHLFGAAYLSRFIEAIQYCDDHGLETKSARLQDLLLYLIKEQMLYVGEKESQAVVLLIKHNHPLAFQLLQDVIRVNLEQEKTAREWSKTHIINEDALFRYQPTGGQYLFGQMMNEINEPKYQTAYRMLEDASVQIRNINEE